MGIPEEQYKAMLLRLEGNKRRNGPVLEDAVDLEIEGLHQPIIQWCRQHQAAYIRARSDMASTIQRGACDFTIFHKGRVFLIECKSRTGKLRPEQIGWAMLAEHNQFKVHVVRSMSEFLEIVK
jgi:hypothetical protein